MNHTRRRSAAPGRGRFRRSPHRGAASAASQKSRNERLPGDVEFHNGIFLAAKLAKKPEYFLTLASMLENQYQYELREAGCDEAGRGCLAGPVFAAAVILPPDFHDPLLNDSKQMTERNRDKLRAIIEREAVHGPSRRFQRPGSTRSTF